MDEEKSSLIPILSMKLDISEESLKKIPTYIECINFIGYFLHARGQLNGQPFKASLPHAIGSGVDSQISYDFPQQGISYTERIQGNGPKFVIQYLNKEPEERDKERENRLFQAGSGSNSKFKCVLDSDDDINKDDLKRLQEISNYLKPTLLSVYSFLRENHDAFKNSEGKGTLESLVVPTN